LTGDVFDAGYNDVACSVTFDVNETLEETSVFIGAVDSSLVVSCYIPHNNSLCLIDKEVLNYYRQLLNKQGGKQ